MEGLPQILRAASAPCWLRFGGRRLLVRRRSAYQQTCLRGLNEPADGMRAVRQESFLENSSLLG